MKEPYFLPILFLIMILLLAVGTVLIREMPEPFRLFDFPSRGSHSLLG